MKITKHLYFVLAILVAFASSCGTTKYTLEEFDKKAKKYVNKKENQGLMVAYVRDGETYWKGYGTKSINNHSSPNVNSVFEVGAVTQVMTTSLMMQLVNENLFDPADCVNEYQKTNEQIADYYPINCTDININMGATDHYDRSYPRTITSCYVDYDAEECVSFCHLASHASGFRHKTKRAYNWAPLSKNQKGVALEDQSESALMAKLHNYTIGVKPGEHYYYSSANMILLANLMAEIKGESYSSMVERYFFEPLEMKQSVFATADQQIPYLIQGHNTDGTAVRTSNFEASLPAAGMLTSAEDLLKFLQAQTDYEEEVSSALQATHEIRVQTYKLKNKQAVAGAYGWLLTPLKSDKPVDVYWMSGATEGYQAFIAFEKKTNTSVVILSNSANTIDDLGFYLLEALYKKIEEKEREGIARNSEK